MYSCFLTIISCFIYRNINQFCDRITNNPHSKTKIISTVHAINAYLISCYYLEYNISNFLFYTLLFTNSIGYFISDTFYLILYKNTMSDALYWQFIVHHIVCLVALCKLNSYPTLIANGFLTEISTPFFNISWYYYKNKIKSIVYYLNLSVLYILFIKYRIINLVYLYLSKYNENLITNIFLGGLIILNFIWIFKITMIIVEEMNNLVYLKKYLKK